MVQLQHQIDENLTVTTADPTAGVRLGDWTAAARYESFDGHRVAVWTAGEGRPLLLVHGYPTSSWDWHRIWAPLAARRRLIACDMLGFGLSDKPASGYSIHRQTDLQEAILESLGVEDYDALVHDYGVSVGQELLARSNEGSARARLGRVVFLNGGLFPEQHRMLPIQKVGTSPLGFLVGWLMNRERFGENFSRVFGADTKPTEAELDDFWQLISHQGGHRLAHKLLHYIANRHQHRARWVEALQQSTVPIKLINGGADPVSGRHLYEYFKTMVPAAVAVCFDDVGHYPQTEAPQRVLDELDGFL
ncbi:MAG: alpha/beta hydrolase [Woeseiaceae bacterium]|nr:alpha/beta hydrolase [Woeseiaceae bacterium]